MSQGFINISVSGSGSIGYYLREEECIAYYHSQGLLSKSAILLDWQRIESDEKFGNKSLGIRGRHDAQVRKNYTLSMPNELSAAECLHRVQKLVDETGIKNCTYTIAVHRGAKDGIENQHVHLLVNERDLRTLKKDREMIKKRWLEHTFRPAYQSVFKEEFSLGKEVGYRERISVSLYESDRAFSRSTIEELSSLSLSNSREKVSTLSFLENFAKALAKDKEEILSKETAALALKRISEQEETKRGVERGDSRGVSRGDSRSRGMGF